MNFFIADKQIGDNCPVFVIAEMSCNHLQTFDYAVQLVKEAKKAGADAIKLQTYTPDTMTLDCNKSYFQLTNTIWEGKSLYELYKEAYTPWEWHDKLKEIAKVEGLLFFSTPFDATSVDFLEELHVPAYKIASYEITDIPLLSYVASKKKPVIFSTGIATLTDIELAMDALHKNGCADVAILKCISAYPTPIEEANLRTIPNIRDTFGVISGLSDHTSSLTAAIASVALGAKVIEKHITLDRSLGGPDASFSLEPFEFKKMVTHIRDAEKALGTVSYSLTDKQKRSRSMARSIFVVEDIHKGDVFTEKNIRVIRPGNGLHPKYYARIIGKKAPCDCKKGTPLTWHHVKE